MSDQRCGGKPGESGWIPTMSLIHGPNNTIQCLGCPDCKPERSEAALECAKQIDLQAAYRLPMRHGPTTISVDKAAELIDAALRAARAELNYSRLYELYWDQVERREKAEAASARLRKRLLLHGQHMAYCHGWLHATQVDRVNMQADDERCDCGLREAIEAGDAEPCRP